MNSFSCQNACGLNSLFYFRCLFCCNIKKKTHLIECIKFNEVHLIFVLSSVWLQPRLSDCLCDNVSNSETVPLWMWLFVLKAAVREMDAADLRIWVEWQRSERYRSSGWLWKRWEECYSGCRYVLEASGIFGEEVWHDWWMVVWWWRMQQRSRSVEVCGWIYGETKKSPESQLVNLLHSANVTRRRPESRKSRILSKLIATLHCPMATEALFFWLILGFVLNSEDTAKLFTRHNAPPTWTALHE